MWNGPMRIIPLHDNMKLIPLLYSILSNNMLSATIGTSGFVGRCGQIICPFHPVWYCQLLCQRQVAMWIAKWTFPDKHIYLLMQRKMGAEMGAGWRKYGEYSYRLTI